MAGKGGMLREPPTSLQDAAPSSTFLRGPQGRKERGQEGPPAPAPKGGRVGPGGSPTGLVQLSWELGALLGITSSPGSRSTGAGPEPRTALPVQPRSTHADPRGRASWPGSGVRRQVVRKDENVPSFLFLRKLSFEAPTKDSVLCAAVGAEGSVTGAWRGRVSPMRPHVPPAGPSCSGLSGAHIPWERLPARWTERSCGGHSQPAPSQTCSPGQTGNP